MRYTSILFVYNWKFNQFRLMIRSVAGCQSAYRYTSYLFCYDYFSSPICSTLSLPALQRGSVSCQIFSDQRCVIYHMHKYTYILTNKW